MGQAALNPSGTWTWSCCQNRHSGTFAIDRFNPDGTFSGRFGDTADDGQTPLTGRLSGSRMEFTRSFPTAGNQTQRWIADLSNDGGRLRTANASVSGYGLGGPADFQATRAAPTAVSKPAPDPMGFSAPRRPTGRLPSPARTGTARSCLPGFCWWAERLKTKNGGPASANEDFHATKVQGR